jgi:hypothetical protein
MQDEEEKQPLSWLSPIEVEGSEWWPQLLACFRFRHIVFVSYTLQKPIDL